MTLYVPILTLVTVCALHAFASPLICSIVCAHKNEYPGLRFDPDCNCGDTNNMDKTWIRDVMERGSRRNSSSLAETTLAPPTTTDICDYLCSIQLGGEACQCSSPGLPGRKRK